MNSKNNLDSKNVLFSDLPGFLKSHKDVDEDQINTLYVSYMSHMKAIYDRFPSKRAQLENIKLLNDFNFANLPEWVLNVFKETFFLFVNNIYIGTVANSDIICEFLAKYIIKLNKVKFNIKESQFQRLTFIKQNEFLDADIVDKILAINKIKNNFVHSERKKNNRALMKQNSLIVLNNLIDVLNHFSVNYFVNPKNEEKKLRIYN